MDAVEADKLAAVYEELGKTIQVMAADHKEYISNIYDEEELLKKSVTIDSYWYDIVWYDIIVYYDIV